MAEILAEPFVSFLVERLGDLLISEAKFLWGVKVQVEQLKAELNRMHHFLKDADAKPEDGDDTVPNWVAEMREVACDVEDVIEEFVIEVALRKGTGGIFNSLMRYSCMVVPHCKALCEVGKKINSIKSRISTINPSRETYRVRSMREDEISRYERQRRSRQSYAHITVKEEDIVGLVDDLKIVVDHLVKEDYRRCGVVSLLGMGGIGKTTLAKMVYHHNEVKLHFPKRAWVYISKKCNTRVALEEILIQLSSPSKEEREEIKAMMPAELLGKLHEFQSENKCLVILDDIWKTETWDPLVPAFPKNNSNNFGSKILLTTRNKDVASYPGDDDRQCFVHKLRLLNEVESWELFQKKAKGNGD